MVTEILILSNLLAGPQHGYDIKRNVRRPGLGVVNNNAVYTALKRLHDRGSLDRRTEETTGRPNRHVFSLTDAGRDLLLEQIADFPVSRGADDEEFYVRFALLYLVDEATRAAIFATRVQALEERMATAQAYLDAAEADGTRFPVQSVAMFRHLLDLLVTERAWVQEYARSGEIGAPRHP
jgi:DNA-binding PadR family transcriptional regulator